MDHAGTRNGIGEWRLLLLLCLRSVCILCDRWFGEAAVLLVWNSVAADSGPAWMENYFTHVSDTKL